MAMDVSSQGIAPAVRALQKLPQPIHAFAADYPAGHVIAPHHHPRAQLVHAETGLMAVEAAASSWLVPPGVALWMPAGTIHEIRAVTALSMRTLYIRPDAAPWLPDKCRVISVSPLLRELILRAVTLPPEYVPDSADGRLMTVMLDEVRRLPAAPLDLPLPSDRRARRVTDALLERPDNSEPVACWAHRSGASARTLARLFVEQTGLTFGQWRQRRRLLAALERLATGDDITAIALDLGYRSPSAFTAMFRRTLGMPPSQYLRSRGGERKPRTRRR